MDPSTSSFDITRPGAGSLRVFRTSTNRPLSDLERGIVRPFIERAQQKLAVCLNPPASLRASLDMQAMSQVVLRLQEYVSHHQALISPLRRFPPEALSEIFLHLAPEHRVNGAGSDVPMILGEICSYWRQVALSTPRLWSVIDVNIKESDERSSCEWIKLLTARSGACLLSVYYDHSDGPAAWMQDSQCCLQELLRSSNRWYTVNLILPLEMCGLLSTIKHDLQELRKLTLQPSDGERSLPRYCDAFAVAPRLSDLTVLSSEIIVMAPWAALKCYTVGWAGDGDGRYMQWLSQCTRLVEADIFFQEGYTFPDATIPAHLPSAPAHLPCLQGLIISTPPQGFLNSITTPVLDRITIEGDGALVDPTDLASLVARSHCQISVLAFKDAHISDIDLITCIGLLQSLTTLTVRVAEDVLSPFTDSFMTALTLSTNSSDGTNSIARKIDTLEFSGELEENCNEELFLLMVKSRPLLRHLQVEDFELDEETFLTLDCIMIAVKYRALYTH